MAARGFLPRQRQESRGDVVAPPEAASACFEVCPNVFFWCYLDLSPGTIAAGDISRVLSRKVR